MSGSRELERLELQMKHLIQERAALEKRVAAHPPAEVPVLLEHQLQDVEDRIKLVERRMATTLQYLDSIREGSYQVLATSRTPQLVIYVLDVSASMSQSMGDETRIRVVELALTAAIRKMIFRSTKGSFISSRYRVAMYAYSDQVYDILSGVKGIDEVAQMGVPQLTTARTTDTAKAFSRVEELLHQEIPKNQNSPAPLVCHITDGEYTGSNPIPIMGRIMDMTVPDGNVLIENILISDDMLASPLESPLEWTGIRSKSQLASEYARVLFDVSSMVPESIRQMMQESGYRIAPGARMLFPGSYHEFIEIGFQMSTSTLVVR